MSDEIVAALEQAVSGLLYSSESDAPFEVFVWPDGPDSVTPEVVLARTNHPPGTPIAGQPVDDFFRGLTQDKGWYGAEERATGQRYRELQALVRQHLPDAQVFRVGRVQVEVYLVGRLADGRGVGIKTRSVET